MLKWFFIIGLSVSVLAFPAKADVNQAIRMYIDTVEKIQSYDVTFDERRIFEEVEDPSNKEILVWTNRLSAINRDIYVSGVGRRMVLEDDYIGQREYCLDWDSVLVAAANRKNGDIISVTSRGTHNKYMDAINPLGVLSLRYSLTNSLTMEGVTLKEVSEKGASCVEIEVYSDEEPGILKAKVWLGCEHGGLPNRVIEYITYQKEKKTYPRSEIEVTQFQKLSDGLWVPLNLTKYKYSVDQYEELHREKELSLSCDLQKCSWNQVPASEVKMTEGLLTEGKLPGWIYSTTQKEILDLKSAKMMIEKAKKRRNKNEYTKVIMLSVVLSILIIPPFILYYIRKRKV
jgi:hypothetical protein